VFRTTLSVCLVLAMVAPASLAAPDTPATERSATSHPAPAAAAGDDPGDPSGARIAAVLPNPIADEDRGEYVALRFPDATRLGGWTLSDGEDRIRLPNRTLSGRVLVTADPGAVDPGLDVTVIATSSLSLSNAGEVLTLSYRNVTVDRVRYEDAPERELLRRSEWHPVGATNRSVGRHGPAPVRAFVLPDAPGVPLDVLRSAEERILLAGYSLTSRRVARTLERADERGVDVRVLVDAAPVGGMSHREAGVLDSLTEAGIEVRVFGGGLAPYEFHHPKYAVADGRAVVTTENWKPAGTGGHGSRGWGAVVDAESVATDLASVFRADTAPPKAVPWTRYRENASLRSGSVANATYPTRFEDRRLRAESVRVLTAPDNAEGAVVGLVENATESVRVEQVSIERGPFLRASVAAARRGVRVRILVSGAWYVEEENRKLVAALEERASREGLDLRAKVVQPRSRFEKVHAKGVVVDGDQALVGSLNWNNHSARENREVALLLSGESVGSYYEDVFRADWRGGLWWLPGGLGILLVLSAGTAIAAGHRRIEFDADPE
jgi:phosphatidylserine/phosphatidylglycerophosphate/cardiolipin synthase-like enzyme